MAHVTMLQRAITPKCSMNVRQLSAARPSPSCSNSLLSVHTRQISTPFRATSCRKSGDVRVRVFNFKFGKKPEETGQRFRNSRSDYSDEDVEDYFNYMGMLAVAGNYDGMTAMLKSGLEPPEILLLWACSEDDFPKVEELLGAGALVDCKDLDGKRPEELAKKPEILSLLKEYEAKQAVSA